MCCGDYVRKALFWRVLRKLSDRWRAKIITVRGFVKDCSEVPQCLQKWTIVKTENAENWENSWFCLEFLLFQQGLVSVTWSRNECRPQRREAVGFQQGCISVRTICDLWKSRHSTVHEVHRSTYRLWRKCWSYLPTNSLHVHLQQVWSIKPCS